MARPSATALGLLLLSLSLLAVVAHCRTLESTDASSTAESTSVVAARASDYETGPPNPAAVVVQTEAAGAVVETVPAEKDVFHYLRLPSHRRHGGRFHRHRGGLFGDGHDGAPNRAEEEEVKPVAEPDPDRSLPDRDEGEGKLVTKPFRRDGHDEAPQLKRWRMFRHGLRHHDHDEEDEEKEMKMRNLVHFPHRRHHHHDEDEEEKMRRPFRFRHAGDEDDEELEEIVRRFIRKVTLRRRFHHGRFFLFRHHHRGHRHHAKEVNEHSNGEQQQQEEGGLMTWIRGLMNQF